MADRLHASKVKAWEESNSDDSEDEVEEIEKEKKGKGAKEKLVDV